MLLLVSVRHVGAHPDQHGVSIQISISWGKTCLRISRIRNIPLTWILARVFAYLPSFISQILDFIYWTILILILIYFEWRDTENQKLLIVHLFLFLCIYRKQKLEKELASDLWRVNYNEISLRARGAGSLRSQVFVVSYWPIFSCLSLAAVPEVFAKVFSAQSPSQF